MHWKDREKWATALRIISGFADDRWYGNLGRRAYQWISFHLCLMKRLHRCIKIWPRPGTVFNMSNLSTNIDCCCFHAIHEAIGQPSWKIHLEEPVTLWFISWLTELLLRGKNLFTLWDNEWYRWSVVLSTTSRIFAVHWFDLTNRLHSSEDIQVFREWQYLRGKYSSLYLKECGVSYFSATVDNNILP